MDWDRVGNRWCAKLFALGVRDAAEDDEPTVVIYVTLDKGKATRLDFHAADVTELTAKWIRDLPLGDVIRNAVSANEATVRRTPIERRKGPHGYDQEHYEKVAAVYRQGQQLRPRSPLSYVAEALDAPPSTVRRWIAECRHREPPLLPPGRTVRNPKNP